MFSNEGDFPSEIFLKIPEFRYHFKFQNIYYLDFCLFENIFLFLEIRNQISISEFYELIK